MLPICALAAYVLSSFSVLRESTRDVRFRIARAAGPQVPFRGISSGLLPTGYPPASYSTVHLAARIFIASTEGTVTQVTFTTPQEIAL